VSDDIVIRFQHLDSKDTSWVSSFSDLFESTYSVSEVRRATLSLNTVLPMSGRRKRGMMFAPSDDAPSSPYSSLNGLDDSIVAGASQNTNEEGVFLSQAALEKLRQDQLAQSRRLLEQVQFEPELLDVRAAVAQPAARKLFAAPQSSTPLFVVKPLQLHTYIFKLSGSEWAEQTPGVMVGVGARQQGGQVDLRPPPIKVTKPSTKPPQPAPIDPIDPVRVMDVVGIDKPAVSSAHAGIDAGLAGVGGNATPNRPQYRRTTDVENILHGHEHTVIPGRTREAWRLIPSRWEYICVLLASIIGVAFFMQALRVMSRGGTNTSEPAVRRGGKKSTL
jgi:hypothetical protein